MHCSLPYSINFECGLSFQQLYCQQGNQMAVPKREQFSKRSSTLKTPKKPILNTVVYKPANSKPVSTCNTATNKLNCVTSGLANRKPGILSFPSAAHLLCYLTANMLLHHPVYCLTSTEDTTLTAALE